MVAPSELSLKEIHSFMLKNGGKVTNHELVKHFKKFLTNPHNQGEARKQFKTYVNILSTMKNEETEKFLVLRKKYLNDCPTEDNLSMLSQSDGLLSPGSRSTISEHESINLSSTSLASTTEMGSPFREPPPYKPPPEVVKLNILETETKEQYRECVDEFKTAMSAFEARRGGGAGAGPTGPTAPSGSRKASVDKSDSDLSASDPMPPAIPPRKRNSSASDKSIDGVSISGVALVAPAMDMISDLNDENKENLVRASLEKQISVKEATKKFNLIASEEEANKVTSPPAKKKPEKTIEEMSNDNLLSTHPKAKEWLVSSARANYQELAKLSSESPELVKLQDPTTGYTALHWAAKHGNEDVVKLIAGTHKADCNARTNGGYTPLHLAMQFGKDNIFELLCNVYKADRDTLDWSGKKPLDYRIIRTSVSASTYSSEYHSNIHSSNVDTISIGSTKSYASNTLPLPRRSKERGTFRKLRNHKRFNTATGAILRTQTMLGYPKSAAENDMEINNTITGDNDGNESVMADVQEPNRSTYFSPELKKGKRQDRKYQSFLFRNK